MYDRHCFVGMYCETPLHAGSGQSVGAVDLPVQREKTTNWLTIQASGIKGAFRSAYEKGNGPDAVAIFGSDGDGERAGAISVGDARLLLLPVRSSIAPFVWVTCPAILRKLKRDSKIVGRNNGWSIPAIPEEGYLGLGGKTEPVIFEDLLLPGHGKIEENVIEALRALMPSDEFYGIEGFAMQLCIISDDNFRLLVETGTEVQARIQLSDQKTSKNLWYQELVPSNTVFYTIISMGAERTDSNGKGAEALLQSVRDTLKGYVQIGGDETLGRGWTRLVWQEA